MNSKNVWKFGLYRKFEVGYTPEQNNTAERKNRTIVRMRIINAS